MYGKRIWSSIYKNKKFKTKQKSDEYILGINEKSQTCYWSKQKITWVCDWCLWVISYNFLENNKNINVNLLI